MTLIVGLTGGIVGGKSTVALMFKNLGAKIIDVDKIGHSVILPHRLAWKKIIRSFGKDFLRNDMTIDRGKLGKIVFANQGCASLVMVLEGGCIPGLIKK